MKRLNYFIDRRIASGTGTLLAWLGALLIVLVIFAIFNTFALSSRPVASPIILNHSGQLFPLQFPPR